MRAFIETEIFRAAAKRFKVSDSEVKGAQDEVLIRPKGDAHLCHTFYKIRVAGRGRGKRGGFRFWYFYHDEDVYFVYVLPKSEGENISKPVQSELCKIVGQILKGEVSNDI